jgi:hypothetical protein
MRARGSSRDVEAYARCAAAQYALIRGFGFARHVRTTMDAQGWNLARGCGLHHLGRAAPRLQDNRRRSDGARLRRAGNTDG